MGDETYVEPLDEQDTVAAEQDAPAPEGSQSPRSGGRKRTKRIQTPLGVMDVPFILFVGALCVFYIWLRNDYERLWREEQRLEVEVRNLRSESLVLSSELMRRSKESEVYEQTESKGLGLKESRTPPVKIEYKER
ncbi:MAG: hypothetical protein CSA07_04535 [Bacteroidia bacterium]|nr:MAG: hypothetical protein CSA07_04535 [Bacteroidia bacterium]